MKYKWICVAASLFSMILAKENGTVTEKPTASLLSRSLSDSQELQKQESYGDLWLRGTLEEKKLYLAGMGSGIHLFKRALESSLYSLDTLNMDSVSLDMLERFKDSMTEWYERLSYIEVDATETMILKWMDALYQKEGNKKLSFQQVYVAALHEWMKARR